MNSSDSMSGFFIKLEDRGFNNDLLLYFNARVIDPEGGKDFHGYVVVRNGLILDFAESKQKIDQYFDEDIKYFFDLQGYLLMPGIVDIHVHFRDPGQTNKEDIRTGSMAAAAGGVTTVVCQPNTKPVIDSELVINHIKYKALQESLINIKFFAAVSVGLMGESMNDLYALKKAGAVGFSDDGRPIANSGLMYRAMLTCAMLGAPIAQHAEDLSLLEVGSCINEGKISYALNVNGIVNVSETIVVQRDILLCGLVPKCHYHVMHVSAKETLEAVRRAKDSGVNITCEVTPNHLLLNEEVVMKWRSIAKINPPLRSESDRLALIDGLVDGTIDVIASDHAPHDHDSKDLPLSCAAFGIIGVETILSLSLSFYHNGMLSLCDLLAKLTYKPAIIIQDSTIGRIKKGCRADFAIVDLNREWRIDAQNLHSKSKNTPFNEYKLKGMVLATLVNGQFVYAREEFKHYLVQAKDV